MEQYKIREDVARHMTEIREWLDSQKDVPLEEMSDFFTARLDDYEEHMQLWAEGYRHLADLIPEDTETILDLGCGTGLELDEILSHRPELSVTGIDLCHAMLEKLKTKHPNVTTLCQDYFQADLGYESYDCVVSFESLHHFLPGKKRKLFEKIVRALKPGGIYLEVDYMAACQEEEDILMEFCRKKRRQQGINEEQFVHFDTPLTAEHEMKLLRDAGFSQVEWLCAIEGASFLRCVK